MEKHKYAALLLSLFSIYLIAPFFQQENDTNHIIEVIFIAVMVFSIWGISHHKGHTFISVLLALPLLTSNLSFLYLENTDILLYVTLVSGTLFFSYMIAVLLKEIFYSKHINLEIIFASICVYLLMGIMWGFLYGLIEALEPGSFLQMYATNNIVDEFIYFSIVTLTTLGYGDIAPLTPIARAFASMQAVIGQIYLTVLVARLVGLHLTQNRT